MFSGIWIPLVTPFHHGQVDTAALRRLVRHYQGAGVSGFVALGTTGEAALLSQIERYTVLEAIAYACADRTPFLIGVGAADTREVCAQIRHYERWNSAGYLFRRRITCVHRKPGCTGITHRWPPARRGPWCCTTCPSARACRSRLPPHWRWQRPPTSSPSRNAWPSNLPSSKAGRSLS